MSAKAKTETRTITDFYGVDLQAVGEMTIVQGDHHQVVITADVDLLEQITTEVNDHILQIGLKRGSEFEFRQINTPIQYRITLPHIQAIRISGSGRAEADRLVGDALLIKVSGSGEIKIQELEYERLAIDITGSCRADIQSVVGDQFAVNIKGSATVIAHEVKATAFASAIKGSGKVKLAGEVQKQALNVPGNGRYDCERLRSEETIVNAPGMANVVVWATKSLAANIRGMGNINYYGDDPHVAQTIKGMGSVRHLGTAPVIPV